MLILSVCCNKKFDYCVPCTSLNDTEPGVMSQNTSADPSASGGESSVNLNMHVSLVIASSFSYVVVVILTIFSTDQHPNFVPFYFREKESTFTQILYNPFLQISSCRMLTNPATTTKETSVMLTSMVRLYVDVCAASMLLALWLTLPLG